MARDETRETAPPSVVSLAQHAADHTSEPVAVPPSKHTVDKPVAVCKRGHELTPHNIYRYTDRRGTRQRACIACRAENHARCIARRRGAISA